MILRELLYKGLQAHRGPAGACTPLRSQRRARGTRRILSGPKDSGNHCHPRDSFEHYECKESMVLAVPYHLGKLGGRYVSIEVLKMDS